MNGSNAAEHVKFLQARALELARFLVWVIRELNIPKADGVAGGLALMGWSLGNVLTTAFLGFLDTYPQDVIDTLKPYLKALFMYGESECSCAGPSLTLRVKR